MPQEAAEERRPTAARAQREAQLASHRRKDMLAVAAITIGVAALITGWIPGTHFVGSVLGLIGLPLALYSQMISATTNQRWLNVIGMVCAFVGGGFALSNGGFSL